MAEHATSQSERRCEAVLVSNGPGELYTWVHPVLRELRAQRADMQLTVSLIPCQFASGGEAAIARAFAADAVTTPGDFLRFVATGRKPSAPAAWRGSGGFVLSLGGNSAMALKLARTLGYSGYRYAFNPYWHPRLKRLFVTDERSAKRSRLLGAPASRLEIVGNLVADAVEATPPLAARGQPHVLVMTGSRASMAVHLIPFMLAVVDRLASALPEARFVWPVSRLLSDEVIAAGIAGLERATLGGVVGRREGDLVYGPGGGALEIIAESRRYAHMRAADLALTIPGTNTLELGIAGVPSVVVLPLNKPELIPLEGLGHWLSLVPLVGTALKRQAVLLAAPRFPVALPNAISGEELMLEIKGKVNAEGVAERALAMLNDAGDLARRRARLQATMPGPGAAAKLVGRILKDLDSGA